MKTIKKGTTWCSKDIDEDFNNDYLYGNLSFATLCKLCFKDMILCNNITEVDESVFDNLEYCPPEDEGDDWEYPEIFQYYIVEPDSCFFELYKDNFLMSYSDKLDVYVLCVTHFGTSWKGVATDVKIVEE